MTRRDAISLVIFAFALATIIAFVRVGHRNAELDRTQCARIDVLRQINLDDKRKQLAVSEQYLVDHPNGAPGIGRALIVQGIEDTRNLVTRLEVQACP